MRDSDLDPGTVDSFDLLAPGNEDVHTHTYIYMYIYVCVPCLWMLCVCVADYL
jgi:hypothetical protein